MAEEAFMALFNYQAMPEREYKIIEKLLRPRTIIAFMFYGVFCYLLLNQMKVPPMLNTIVSTLMGYFFGSTSKKNNKEVIKKTDV